MAHMEETVVIHVLKTAKIKKCVTKRLGTVLEGVNLVGRIADVMQVSFNCHKDFL